MVGLPAAAAAHGGARDGDHGIQEGLRHLQHRDPDRFSVRFAYDEGLAHKIMAGCDVFLMPSRSEPCGLTQMYALRYGTVPVVRTTGGLADTVEPYDPAKGKGTGFRFDNPDGTGLLWAVDQALEAFRDRKAWTALMKRGWPASSRGSARPASTWSSTGARWARSRPGPGTRKEATCRHTSTP